MDLEFPRVKLLLTSCKEETELFEGQWKEVTSLETCPWRGRWHPPVSLRFLPRGVSSFVLPCDPNHGALSSPKTPKQWSQLAQEGNFETKRSPPPHMLRFLGYFATAMEKLGNFHSPPVPTAMGTGLKENAGVGKVGFQESMSASGACV